MLAPLVTHKQHIMEPKITIEQYNTLQNEQMPFANIFGLELESITEAGVYMRARYDERFLRPGGTVSGPVMMALADASMYALVLSRIGAVELAVTTNLNINFLRKPLPGDVIAFARMLKLGKRLAVGDVILYSDGESAENAVAHVTSSYSIPPNRAS
jgi:uncharacterized protein (TIGR00369 family)